jgi:asparagine synthase (glutamine-hydrolysing)
MAMATQHRGPDHLGHAVLPPVALGHNRLSIIDLSDASHQPMQRESLTLTYNGEIYNYIELRQELEQDGHQFTTSGDTEVILAAYRQWGAHCVERFIGMWAFAIWDEERQELFCSRDRFGIKPFHYMRYGTALAFASEIKALRHSGYSLGSWNLDQLARGLYLGWMSHHEETSFENVHILPASHNLRWHNGHVDIWQYADVCLAEEHNVTFAESAERFSQMFRDSIRITSRRDVPMGVCLSGGLDSTSIVATLATSGSESSIKTFTAYYEGNGRADVDERPYINHLLRRYPDVLPAYISPTDVDVEQSINDIAGMMDAPLPSSSYVSQYFVMRLAAQHGVKVVLDGQGSDEMLGGYMHSAYRVIADLLRSAKFPAAYSQLRAHGQRQGMPLGQRLQVAAKSLLTAVRTEESIYRLEFSHTAPWVLTQKPSTVELRLAMPHGTRFNAFLLNLMRTTLLPTLLHTEDINAMAWGIESRVPFLDHRLVDLCMTMPTAHRFHNGESKRVLRAAMRGTVPDAILDRADKTGFITPGHTRWLRGGLRHLVEGSWSELDGIAKLSDVQRHVADYLSGNNKHALFIWRLAMLRLFIQRYS